MKSSIIFLVVLTTSSAFLILPKDEPQCKAANGGGLDSAFKEFLALLPEGEIASIFINAVSNDHQVEKVMEFLQSDKFEMIILSVQKQPAIIKFLEFVCKSLYFDAYYYLNFIGDQLGLPPIQKPNSAIRNVELLNRCGLVGLLQDIIDVLPLKEIKKMYEEKLANDEYLRKAAEAIKSPEFRSLVEPFEKLPEFIEFANHLRGFGVDVDSALNAIKKFFEWK